MGLTESECAGRLATLLQELSSEVCLCQVMRSSLTARVVLVGLAWGLLYLSAPPQVAACPWGSGLYNNYCSEGSYYVHSTSADPVFQINAFPKGSSDHAYLVVAVPTAGLSGSLNFSATFSQTINGFTSTDTFSASAASIGTYGEYALFAFDTHLNVTSGNPGTSISVTFGNFSDAAAAFPDGTVFLTVGLDPKGNVIGLQLVNVPEPGTLTLLGSGLAWLGLLSRRPRSRSHPTIPPSRQDPFLGRDPRSL